MNTIVRPITTEKTMKIQANSDRYTFQVEQNATKREIKNALRQLFNVDAKVVQTINVKGARKRVGKRRLKTPVGSWKKAIVKLAPGQKISVLGKEEKESK